MDLPHRLPPEELKRRASGVLLLAFAADPMARWTWRDPERYLATFPEFAAAFGGRAFEHGSAFIAEDFAGAALWLPPGVEPDEAALGALIERTAQPGLEQDIATILEQMGRYHPAEPHWYLPLIGVDPARQGEGHGSRLMRRALEAADRDGVAAYLESANPRNVPFYQRLGFELLGTIQAGSSPKMFPMLRKPRG
jgi:ribosomal protein S18 acetylase RimI-like enzyme